MAGGVSDRQTFAVIYRPGPEWRNGTPFHQQLGVIAHRDFLAGEHANGGLMFGGLFLDDSGGLSIFYADSAAELEERLKRDSTVANGLMKYQIHPYAIGFKPR